MNKEDKTIIPGCVSLLENTSDESEMLSPTVFHPICIFLAAVGISCLNFWFNINFQGKLVESLGKTSSVQHHLSHYLMLHLILRRYTSPQCSELS